MPDKFSIFHRALVPTHPEPTSQKYIQKKHETSDPKIFISHISVLNFAWQVLHFTPRIGADPSWTNITKIH